MPEIQRIPHSIISGVEVPITETLPPPVSRGMSLPVFTIPDYSIKYPVINVPTQEEYDAAVQKQREEEQKQQEEKSRGLPDSPTPEAQSFTPKITIPEVEAPKETVPQTPKLEIAGMEIYLPEPSMVATAATLAVASTVATMGATMGFNALKKSLGPAMRDAARKKFKIQIRYTKPVLHFVTSKDGHVEIFEYSDEGTKLVDRIEDVERYLRDKIETNPLYEVDNKVIIDDSMADRFSREGKERFKVMFAPPKKIAKRLGAKLSLF